MKRTQHINLQRMRKAYPRHMLKPLALAITGAMLSGCGSPLEEANAFTSVLDCEARLPEQADLCQYSYQEALREAERTAPKYATRADCEFEFGAEQCVEQPAPVGQARPEGQGGEGPQAAGGSWFMPAMAGFLMGRMMGAAGQQRQPVAPLYSSQNPRSPAHNRWVTADGQTVGNRAQSRVGVNRDVFQPKPTVNRTISRGGFGATAAARSAAAPGGNRGMTGG
jgi:uncharacterized protein YgiB involved in biofilm formation